MGWPSHGRRWDHWIESRPVRLAVHIAWAPDWGDHATVADGASRLLASVFKSCGSHARLAIGASSLPAHMPIELEMIFVFG
jgi:hypothetical protein